VPTALWFGNLGGPRPPLAFVVIQLFGLSFGLIQAMMSSNRSTWDSLFFSVVRGDHGAVWGIIRAGDDPRLIVAALMPMTWGDALAPSPASGSGDIAIPSLVRRQLEGSVTMLVVSTLAAWMALWALPSQWSVALTLQLEQRWSKRSRRGG